MNLGLNKRPQHQEREDHTPMNGSESLFSIYARLRFRAIVVLVYH